MTSSSLQNKKRDHFNLVGQDFVAGFDLLDGLVALFRLNGGSCHKAAHAGAKGRKVGGCRHEVFD